TSGVEPKWVMMAPVGAVQKIWQKTGWKKDEVDLYELNEAFSVQALGVIRELGLDMERVNVNGGAVALGHPIGASGARVLVTLIYEMIRRDVHRGIAALCLGGGNAVAMAVERYDCPGRRPQSEHQFSPITVSGDATWARSAHCQSAPCHAMKQVVHFLGIRFHSFVDPPVEQREQTSCKSVGLGRLAHRLDLHAGQL